VMMFIFLYLIFFLHFFLFFKDDNDYFLTLNYIYILNQLDELYVNILSKLRDFTL
jgi:hypothetical protein